MAAVNNVSLVRHILVLEDQGCRRTISLEENRYSIGRHSSNSVMLYSKQASRKHATLVRKTNNKTNDYSFWILDGDLEGNKSHNGIFVNGAKCLVHELRDGDLINFGCNVNASYHMISNVSDTHFDRESVSIKNSKEQSIDPSIPGRQLQKTLILTDSSLDSSNNDDTFQDQAYRDSLTDLPNRTLFNEHLSIALTNAKRNQIQMAIILLNLENFSHVNDTLGYGIGDQALQSFSQYLKTSLRSIDIVARWGGDEFIVLLPQINNTEDITKIGQRILNSLNRSFEIEQHQVYLRQNAGIVIYPQDGEDGKTLLRKAKISLENTKKHNKERAHLLDSRNNAKTSQFLKIEQLLYKALEQQEFSLHYQPQVNINTGELYGMEALLRWQHPELGLLSPRQFIPWAEKSNLIVPLNQWVLRTACRQNKAWQKAELPSLPVAVNLSARQFQDPSLTKTIAQVLEETGLESQWLEVEITETTIMQNVDLARQVCHDLQQMGVRIALDDFGTGYFSLSDLQEFSFTKLKIDRSYVNRLKENPGDTAMISAVIALGHSFNLKVLAEGVETQQQLELLRHLQCEEMQGYRFSPPLKVEEASEFLSLHRTTMA
jgi:diguanylate cyclase (GGDEF)-like protein